MTSHFGLLVLFAFFVSLVFAVIGRDTPRDQLALGSFTDQQARHQLVAVDWQSWTWRQERLRRYLAEHPFAPALAARHN